MAELDYYKVLGVSREASADEIRKAYRKLSRQYHPDMKPNDQEAVEKFKQVQEAFEILGDTEKREQYDRYGSAFQGGRQPGPGPGGRAWGRGPAGGAGPIDLGDLFGGGFDLGDLFGAGRGGARAARPRPGESQSLEIDVPFQTAAEGGSYELHLQRDGKPERITIKIPPGVDTGSVIRLAGQGQPGQHGGPPGDLLVTIRVMPHPYFRREGNNLLLDVPLTFTEAGLGAKVEVPTLSEGKVTLTIPPGTSSGTKLRLRSKGIPDRETKQRGDQYVIAKIIAPQKPNPQAQELLQQLAIAAPQSPRDGLW
jgi:DnaJ-class molecular chaperone